jgi:ComF family protein
MKLFQDFLHLIFPENCMGCHQVLIAGEQTICTTCQVNLPFTNHIQNAENELKINFYGRVDFKYAMSMLQYSKYGIVQNMLHHLKYNNSPEIGYLLGNIMAENMLISGNEFEFDTVIPVPLHQNRKEIRGYNQAEAFAKPIAEKLDAQLDVNAVVRTVSNLSQTKFSGVERWKNVENIFKVEFPEYIYKKNILIVDDVVTTGATIESMANELLKFKPKSISLIAIAKAISR